MEQKVGSAFIEIEAKLDQLEGRLSTEIKSIAEKGGQNFTSSFTQALWPLKWMIASVVSIGAFVQISKSIITLADNLEQAKNAFTTMLWSAEQAETMLQNLSDFAAKTPFELPEVRQNAKQLLAMGVSAENIIPTMKALGDVASWTGADMSRLAMNYGQVITQGKLTSRELKDFQVNGVPILDELAKNAGKSKEEIQNMISSGQISANDVTRAFETMTSEGGKFADMMATQSSTLSGQWSNFQDQLSQIGEKIWVWLLDNLKGEVGQMGEIIEAQSDNIINSADAIYDSVFTVWDAIKEVLTTVWEFFGSIFEGLGIAIKSFQWENNEATSGIKWDWTDLFYYLELWIDGVVGAFRIAFSFLKDVLLWLIEPAVLTINTIGEARSGGISAIRSRFSKLGADIWNIFIDMANGVLKTVNRLGDKLNYILPKSLEVWSVTLINRNDTTGLKSQLNHAMDGTKIAWDATKKSFINNMSKARGETTKVADNVVGKMIDTYAERTWQLIKKTEEKNKELDTKFKYGDNKAGGSGWGWGGWKSSNKAEKEALKEVKESYTEIEKKIKEHSKAVEDAEKKVENLNKKYNELKETAKKAFYEAKQAVSELDQEIEKSDVERSVDLWARYQDIQRQLKEERAKLKEDGKDWMIEQYDKKALQEYQDKGYHKLYDIEVKKLLEIQDLLAERALIEKNTTEAQRKSQDFTEQTSKAQEILNKYEAKAAELEEKKAIAMEKQAIAKALSEGKKIESKEEDGELKARYEDETGKMVEVTNFKNIQYAQDLFNKSESIRLEKEEVEKKLLRETAATQNLINEKIRLDQEYTKIHNKEIDKQKGKVDELIAKYQALAKAKFGGWGAKGARAFGGAVQAGLPYLIGENYKPEMFIPSTSGSVVPVNNYNQSRTYHFSGVTINANNAQDFWSEIQNHIGDYT